ncbi:MAG: hypothetical protein JST12_10670 [Armatimonadetes bacterium]|nr:hypothetical protein [Armatimonadota bacterium]MBS1702114.1 hypothetical protein [Armatimonadota bacterium]MBS1728046.1 hypothetical protein [Armatimonadota bacterium]
MSEGTRNILKLIGVILLIYVGYKLVLIATHMVLSLLIPVAILGGIGYVIYRAAGGKPLMGGRKTLP